MVLSNKSYDVAIVGGGYAGLNLAYKLSKNHKKTGKITKKTGKKRAKLKNVMKKNGRFRVFLYPLP